MPPLNTHSAIVDSGCTGHYFPPNLPVTNIQPIQHDFAVTLPDSSKIQATHTAAVSIPTLDSTATKTYLFPNLHSALLSVGQLCDANCTVTFQKQQVLVYNDKKNIIATGIRDPQTGLWKIPLPITNLQNQNEPTLSLANGIIKRDTPVSDLCHFRG